MKPCWKLVNHILAVVVIRRLLARPPVSYSVSSGVQAFPASLAKWNKMTMAQNTIRGTPRLPSAIKARHQAGEFNRLDPQVFDWSV